MEVTASAIMWLAFIIRLSEMNFSLSEKGMCLYKRERGTWERGNVQKGKKTGTWERTLYKRFLFSSSHETFWARLFGFGV
jgi:hypothetical protein